MYVPTLKTKYKEEIVPALMKEFSYKTVMQVPRLKKIVLNQGECATMRAGLEHRPTGETDAIVLTVLHKTIRTSKHNFPEVKDKL